VGEAPVKFALQAGDILGITAHKLSFGVGNLCNRATVAFDDLHDLIQRFQTAVVGQVCSDTETNPSTFMEVVVKLGCTFEIEGVGEEQGLLQRVSTTFLDCVNHLVAPHIRVARVMSETIPDTDIVAGEVFQEDIGTDTVSKVDTVAALVLSLPSIHHETVGVGGVVHRVALADCFDGFVSDRSNELYTVLQCEIHIGGAEEDGITEDTALLCGCECTDEVILNLAGETTAETEFGECTETILAACNHANLLVDTTHCFGFEFSVVRIVVVEVDFIHDGEHVDFEERVHHKRVEITTSFKNHVGRLVFDVRNTDLATVEAEQRKEMPVSRGKPSGFLHESVDFFTGKREGAEVVELAVDFRHVFLGELHDAAILAVAALVGPLSGVVAVLGEVEVVHVELVEVCLKQTFYAPMVEHIVTFL